jgi:valyl-tRNA synthetase
MMKYKDASDTLPTNTSDYDAWILLEYNKLLFSIEKHFSNFELNAIARELYEFVWHSFCDWYLEFIKIVPSKNVAKYLLKQVIIILHPFIPFITEEIYHKFDFSKRSIILEKWPSKIEIKEDTKNVSKMKKLIEGARNIRGLFDISPKEKLNCIINTDTHYEKFLKGNLNVLKKLAGLERIEFNKQVAVPVASVVMPDIECYIMLTSIDTNKEKRRLKREIESLTQRIDKIKYRLANPEYINQAANDIKDKEKQRLDDFMKKKEGIEKAIKKL